MTEIARSALFGKLNQLLYKAIEGATVFCKLRGNPYVEIEHWFHQLLQEQDSDLHRIIRHYELDAGKIAKELTAALDRLPRGASSISDLSSHLEHAVERAWVYASLMYGESAVRSSHIVLGMLKTRDLRSVLVAMSSELAKIKADDLSEELHNVVSGSPEDQQRPADGSALGDGVPGETSGAMAPAQMGREEAIAQFCKDLTEQARSGHIDAIVGRDMETRQVVDILMRRRQNNPILTGEAGVGKTAVVEGFAHKIITGDVPPTLRDVRLLELDLAALQAGASMKGEFENRLKQVIEEVQSSARPIVLFIDEVHTLMGAGGAAGTGDAAQLLKPALARGTLRTIAATTWAEYKKHIEKDPALTRRFQVVKVEEPTEDRAILMMRKVAGMLEKHHKLQILDEAVEASVRLSHRYIPARQLPDKSVSLLDTACARVAIGQHAVPAQIDDSRKRVEALETELEILGRESDIGIHHGDRIGAIESILSDERERLAGLEKDWEVERDLVNQILEIRGRLRGASGVEPVEGTGSRAEEAAEEAASEVVDEPTLSDEERAAITEELERVQAKLDEVQGDSPLILPCVDEQAVAAVVGDWTGIPVGRMVKNEVETVLNLAGTLGNRVIGQDHGLEAIARRIQTSRAGLDNPQKPIGVFLLAGPSGVGKTETALAIAETLYGGDQNVITINMSEFQEAHTVSTLKGSPPGYVGYGEGGVLTEAVRRRPYSVVLLDEVEKAHPDVHEIFFQVFDKGIMEDGEGRQIDFKNTIILLTSNAGTDLIMNMCKDPELMPDVEGLTKALREPLLKVFPPALLGRMVTIPYYPLSDDVLRKIVVLQLNRIVRRVEAARDLPFEYTDDVVELIVSRCTEIESGGRMVDAILTNTLLPTISREILSRFVDGNPITRVGLRVEDGDFAYDFE